MSAKILNSQTLASSIKQDIKKNLAVTFSKYQCYPGLAVILVGNDPASEVYVHHKRLACEEVGIRSHVYHLESNLSQQQLLDLITTLNQDPSIHGILVQLPLPSHLNANQIMEHIDPKKDVDGFHPYNLGRLAQGRPLLRPCTPLGIMLLLESTGIDLKGIHATVVGISNIVGRPMILELLLASATVTACHRQTQNLSDCIRQAELLITAVGKPHLISGDWIKPGAIVIDVGMNRLPNNKLVGDVDFESAQSKASFITPVPGGVGPMTVACLLKNTLLAFQLQMENMEKIDG